MNRFKFRIWDGAQFHNNIELGDGDDGYFSWGYLDSNCVIQQFTGLYDCRNEPIYEGDLLAILEDDSYYVVTWNKEHARFEAINDTLCPILADSFNMLIVIGSYFENKDLLKNEKRD